MDGMGDGCRLGAEVILTEEGSMSVSAVDRSPVDKGIISSSSTDVYFMHSQTYFT